MWRLTWAQMRRTVGRLVAVGIAVALGTAFIAATFIATGTIQHTALEAARAGVGDPDLVVLDSSYAITPESLTALGELDGVAAVQPIGHTYREVQTVGASELVGFSAPASDPRLGQVTMLEGSAPGAAGELVVPAGTASRLGLSLGDEVTLVSYTWLPDADTPERTTEQMTLSGISADGSGLGFAMPLGLAHPDDLAAWALGDGGQTWSTATLALADGAASAEVTSAVVALVPGAEVITGEEYARQVAASFTGGVSVFRGLILGFAGVAMAVAGIVIANTFTVLIAQRTRTLALLRCVGATRGQVRSSVRREALLLGIVSSLVGVLLGLGLGQLVLFLLGRANDGVPLPDVVPVDGWTIGIPLVVGVLVTVIAASGAARAATRVAPLEAMRPSAMDSETSAKARWRSPRAVFGWILVVGGFAAMALAVAWSHQENSFELAFGLGVLGGIVSIVGVVLAAITIVPAVVRGFAAVIARLGSGPARLAASNAVRNPRRTTSTATALLVGVSLVTMMSTGASTARTQLDGMLRDQFAVDVAVTAQAGQSLPPSTVEAVQGVAGVSGSSLMDTATAEVSTPDGVRSVTVIRVLDAAAFLGVVHSAPDSWVRGTAFADGYTLSADGPLGVGGVSDGAGSGDASDGAYTLDGILLDGLPDYSVVLDAEVFDSSGFTVDGQTLWLSLDDDADPRDVVAAVTEAVSATTVAAGGGGDGGAGDDGAASLSTPGVTGGAVERAGFAQIVDTLLIVVIGLLGVAVVIALIGVANTLSLSVVERRQENALLRALGLTRRQLRLSLAVEGVVLALVGALVGMVLGLIYGWLGSQLMFGSLGGTTVLPAVPWMTLLAVIAVAVVSGVLASVLPARGAVKVSPVAALAA